MNANPFKIVRDFEGALCEYTGAPYAVTTTSCTMALLLAVAWHLRETRQQTGLKIEIPKRTYCSVPMSIIHAGGWPTFRDEDWLGWYQLKPLPVWDSARYLSSGMYEGGAFSGRRPAGRPLASGGMVCVSFHHSKTLGDTQGGAILHDDPEADRWLRRARFDGRTEGEAATDGAIAMVGWHAYMSPDVAARLLWKLSKLPKHNAPLPNDDYPDLSKLEIFQ